MEIGPNGAQTKEAYGQPGQLAHGSKPTWNLILTCLPETLDAHPGDLIQKALMRTQKTQTMRTYTLTVTVTAIQMTRNAKQSVGIAWQPLKHTVVSDEITVKLSGNSVLLDNLRGLL